MIVCRLAPQLPQHVGELVLKPLHPSSTTTNTLLDPLDAIQHHPLHDARARSRIIATADADAGSAERTVLHLTDTVVVVAIEVRSHASGSVCGELRGERGR